MCTLSFRSFEETRGVGRASEVRVPKRGRRVAKGYNSHIVSFLPLQFENALEAAFKLLETNRGVHTSFFKYRNFDVDCSLGDSLRLSSGI